MSLINDALKKAQNMHSPGQGGGLKLASKTGSPQRASAAPGFPAPSGNPANEPPPPVDASPAPAARKSARHRPGLILAIAGAVFAATLCAVGGAFFLIWKTTSGDNTTDVEPALAAAKPVPLAAASAEPVAPAVVPATEPLPAAPPEQPAAAAVSPEPATTPAPLPAAPVVAEAASELPLPAAQEPIAPVTRIETPVAPAPPPRPARDPKLQAFALTITVTGIRTGDKPKALVNDRVYSIGEYISPEHDLKLTKIDERMLELQDSHGNPYEIRF